MSNTTINEDGEVVTFEEWCATGDQYLIDKGFPVRLTAENMADVEFMQRFEAAEEESIDFANKIHKMDGRKVIYINE